MVKYPEIVVQLDLEGPGGNAYVIMGHIAAQLRRAGVSREEITAYYAESTCGDYEDLLATAGRWVTVE